MTEEFFTSYDEVSESFDSMGLGENLLRGIYAYGFEKPSTIQQRGGLVSFSIGSGTGKTYSGILRQLGYGHAEIQALVLDPTFLSKIAPQRFYEMVGREDLVLAPPPRDLAPRWKMVAPHQRRCSDKGWRSKKMFSRRC
ncbi:eukaryotic initiation factor 4A-like [Impatiens glandulifera]|uniref:eukaryotic initiation factor 4A-like n=1 Tax=Impatiens glandulifera TaxID=253017 RepID=UPI001FB0CC6B|nr:eukaryotic initiation factor 4A-like [Impatiens glandulifera]